MLVWELFVGAAWVAGVLCLVVPAILDLARSKRCTVRVAGVVERWDGRVSKSGLLLTVRAPVGKNPGQSSYFLPRAVLPSVANLGSVTYVRILDESLVPPCWLRSLPSLIEAHVGPSTLPRDIKPKPAVTPALLPKFGGRADLETIESMEYVVLASMFCNLSALRVLDLSRRETIAELPDSMCRLRHLEEVDLAYCCRLRRLPEAMGELGGLRLLQAYGCASLEELPASVGGLTALAHANLGLCRRLEALPDSIGGCTQLADLSLFACEGLTALPYSMAGLVSLSRINTQRCSNITDPPAELLFRGPAGMLLYWKSRQEEERVRRVLAAVGMALHPRLGSESPLAEMGPDLLDKISALVSAS